MVKKLLKYEFSSLFKTLLPMEIILMGIALLTRFVELFENDSKTFSVFMWSSVIALIISMIVCLVMTVVICIVRFYKNNFTAQGYLTLSLPVSYKKHIFAKLISSFVTSLISLASVIVAFIIASLGDVLTETFKVVSFLIKESARKFKWNLPFYIIEFALMISAFIFMAYLLSYACIAIGQMAKKNRILAAFGAFFGYYIIKQLIGTVVVICFVVFHKFFEKLALTMAGNITVSLHIIFCLLTVLFVVLGIFYFWITEHIMKKKLNIE